MLVRNSWERLRDAYQGGMRQQITMGGFAFTAVLVLVGLAAFISANNLIFLIFAALMATFLISGLVSRLGLAGLELNLQLPEHIAARRKVTGRLRIRNSKLWMPSFSLHLSGFTSDIYAPLIPAGATLDEAVELEFARRGLYKENTFAFTSRFPFGFTVRRAQVKLQQEILVYPCLEPQPGFEMLLTDIAGEIESRVRGRGSDFYRIRPYEAHESSRHVDWKATAHTGNLQVREFAREQDRAATIFLDLEVPDEALRWFESAVDCAAFLVWRLSQHGAQVRFLTQRFEARVPEDASAYDILKYLALVAPQPGAFSRIPHDRNYQIALTARPDKLVAAGWSGDRVIGLDDLAVAGPDADAAAGGGARPHQHHSRGADHSRGSGVPDGSREGRDRAAAIRKPG